MTAGAEEKDRKREETAKTADGTQWSEDGGGGYSGLKIVETTPGRGDARESDFLPTPLSLSSSL